MDRGRILGAAIAIAVLVAAASAATASAALTFGPHQTIANAGGVAASAIAYDDDGRATVVWSDAGTEEFGDPGINWARLDADGTIADSGQLSETPYSPDVEVVVDSDGEATVLWEEAGQTYRARILADDTVAPGAAAIAGSSGGAEVVVDSQDRVTVAWSGESGAYATRYADDGSVSYPPVQLAPPSQSSFSPSIAVDPNDRVSVAWEARDGSSATAMYVRIAADGTPGGALPLGDGVAFATLPDVAVAPGGLATVVWRSPGEPGENDLVARRVATDGSADTERVLVPDVSAVENFGDEGPAAASDSLGRVTAIVIADAEAGEQLVAVRLTADGTAGPKRVLAAGNITAARLVVDPAGRATVAFNSAGQGTQARRIGADGLPGAAVSPGPSSSPASFSNDFTLALDPDGEPALLGGTALEVRLFRGDTVEPRTTIVDAPAATNSATPEFAFSSSEPNSTFSCTIDQLDFVPCSSPFTPASPLSEGAHTFHVRATDPEGAVESIAASHEFDVDLTSPDTAIDSGPAEGARINDRTPTFTFSSPEAGAVFDCSVDSTSDWAPCSTGFTTDPLSEGQHTVRIRARDDATNQDATPASRTFVVDTTRPRTTIDFGPAPGAAVPFGDVTFGFSSTEAGTFECRLDGGGFTPCGSPRTLTGLAPGSHTFAVRAVDLAGNADLNAASRQFTVDAAPPPPPPPSGDEDCDRAKSKLAKAKAKLKKAKKSGSKAKVKKAKAKVKKAKAAVKQAC
jgi:hypothetical protein